MFVIGIFFFLFGRPRNLYSYHLPSLIVSYPHKIRASYHTISLSNLIKFKEIDHLLCGEHGAEPKDINIKKTWTLSFMILILSLPYLMLLKTSDQRKFQSVISTVFLLQLSFWFLGIILDLPSHLYLFIFAYLIVWNSDILRFFFYLFFLFPKIHF